MSVTPDASASQAFGAIAPLSMTIGVGATSLVVAIRDDASLNSGVTWNGVAMTLSNQAAITTNGYYLFHLANPASGTHNIVVGGTTTGAIAAQSFTGGDGTIEAAFTLSNSAAASAAFTTITDNDRCVLLVADRSGTPPTAGSNSTVRVQPGGGASLTLFDGGPVHPAGSFTMGFGATPNEAIIGFAIKPLTPSQPQPRRVIPLNTWDAWIPPFSTPYRQRQAVVATFPPPAPPVASPNIVVSIGGVIRTVYTDMPSIKIKDNLNEQPNTASITVRGFTPSYGQEILIGLGSLDPTVLIFGGFITDLVQGYDLIPGASLNVFWQMSCLDYMWLLNRRRPIGNFTSQPADQVITSMMSSWGSGFTLVCPAGLPSIAISFNGSRTFAQCLTDVTNLIGYHWKVDYARRVRIFAVDSGTAPVTIDINNTVTQAQPGFTYEVNIDQIRNLVTGYGIPTQLAGDITSGETIIPVNSVTGYDAPGGQSLVGFINNTYSGIQVGGTGAFVGPGAAPSVAPLPSLAIGAGLGSGVYTYSYTYITSAGESLPAPLASVTTGAVVSPPVAPISNGPNFGKGGSDEGFYRYVCTYLTSAGETTAGSSFDVHVIAGEGWNLILPIGPALVTSRRLYRTVADPNFSNLPFDQLKLVATIADNTTTNYADLTLDSGLGANIPTSNTAGAANSVNLSNIAIGPSGTTSRKVYRTAVGGSQLKLLTTIANNTGTTFADTTADGSLGANAPTSDTSGLTQPNGQVLAGSTSLITAGTTPFSATGGWGKVGSTVFRYTGITSGSLTGIPTTGPGSLTASVSYGSTVVAVPALVGVTGITAIQLAGTFVAIRYTQSDLTSQALMSSAEGGDGVHEYVFYDSSITSVFALTAAVQANLVQYAYPIVSLQASSRDINDVSGRAITVNLPAPMSISVVVLIQSVEISHVGTEQNAFPLYTARASSVKFTLQDLIRQLGGLLSS